MLSLLNTLLIGIIVLEINIKPVLLSTYSMNALLMFNPGFNLKLMNLFVFIFMHYHIIIHMPNRQTIICTQKIPQWHWFAIVPFFRCINLIYSFFLSFFFNNKLFFNVKPMTFFCKCNIIKCLIGFFVSSEYLVSFCLF